MISSSRQTRGPILKSEVRTFPLLSLGRAALKPEEINSLLWPPLVLLSLLTILLGAVTHFMAIVHQKHTTHRRRRRGLAGRPRFTALSALSLLISLSPTAHKHAGARLNRPPERQLFVSFAIQRSTKKQKTAGTSKVSALHFNEGEEKKNLNCAWRDESGALKGSSDNHLSRAHTPRLRFFIRWML